MAATTSLTELDRVERELWAALRKVRDAQARAGADMLAKGQNAPQIARDNAKASEDAMFTSEFTFPLTVINGRAHLLQTDGSYKPLAVHPAELPSNVSLATNGVGSPRDQRVIEDVGADVVKALRRRIEPVFAGGLRWS